MTLHACPRFSALINVLDAAHGDVEVVAPAKKEDAKEYFSHSGYPGGVRLRTPRQVRDSKPTFIVENAVKGMLPKGPLGRQMLKKLKAYAGTDHPHEAQQPEALTL